MYYLKIVILIQVHNSNKNIIIGPNLDITNSNLSNREFTGFNFTNCSFSGVILEGANLTNIILSKTIGGPFSGTVTIFQILIIKF